MNQDNQNIMDNMMDAQKKVVDSVVENTKKFAGGNTIVADTMQKGSEWYKNWLENQKNIFSQTTEKANVTSESAKENVSKMNDYYQNWLGTQMNTAKQVWDMNTNFAKNAANGNAYETPASHFNNGLSQWNNWVNSMTNAGNSMNNMNNFFSQFQNANPFNMDAFKKMNETSSGFFNQYSEILNNTFAGLQKNLKSTNIQDAYRNMVNVTDGFSKFSEMWAPMWKSVQDKSFNLDMYKQYGNPAMYKEVMDKYFGFIPDNARQHMQSLNDLMTGGFKNMNRDSMNQYHQFRNMMGNIPGMGGNEIFGNMLNAYTTVTGMMNDAVAPLTKMMTPNQYTKAASEWSDLSNRIMVYNIKNAELQYMIYNQGTTVMDKLADNIVGKIEKGEEINSIMALYQEWLNLSDKVYVSLFESEDYSKLMAEVSAMQLRLRKDIENQIEKSLVGIPVATRSEMDELYKTIYDLKKQVRELERSMNFAEVSANEAAEAASSLANLDTTAEVSSEATVNTDGELSEDKTATNRKKK
jgi:hypothetical protein